jgi:hypothetical protein
VLLCRVPRAAPQEVWKVCVRSSLEGRSLHAMEMKTPSFGRKKTHTSCRCGACTRAFTAFADV